MISGWMAVTLSSVEWRITRVERSSKRLNPSDRKREIRQQGSSSINVNVNKFDKKYLWNKFEKGIKFEQRHIKAWLGLKRRVFGATGMLYRIGSGCVTLKGQFELVVFGWTEYFSNLFMPLPNTSREILSLNFFLR